VAVSVGLKNVLVGTMVQDISVSVAPFYMHPIFVGAKGSINDYSKKVN